MTVPRKVIVNCRNRDLSPVIFVPPVTAEVSLVAGVAIATVDAHDPGLRPRRRCLLETEKNKFGMTIIAW